MTSEPIDPREAALRILKAKEECVKDGNVPLYCYSSEDDQVAVAMAVASGRLLYEFKVKDNVHVQHPAVEQGSTYKGMCLGRVMRLAYPFGWDQECCKRECCQAKPAEDDPEGGPMVWFTRSAWNYIDLYYCMDCGRIGTITVEGKTTDKPDWPQQADALVPTTIAEGLHKDCTATNCVPGTVRCPKRGG